MSEQECSCELLHTTPGSWSPCAAELGFLSLVAMKHSCSCVHRDVFVYTHTCMCGLLFHTMHTHLCLSLVERGLLPRLVEAGGRLGLEPGCSIPAGAMVRKVKIRSFEVSGFHCFPCACFPETPVNICVLPLLWGRAVGVLDLLVPNSKLQCFIWPGSASVEPLAG